MARIPDLKRLAKEDFPSKYKDLIERLVFPINSFHEQVRSALNKNIDFTNLDQEIKTLEFTTNSDGNPIAELNFKSDLNSKVKGIIIVRVVITSNNTSYVNVMPVISWSQNEKTININNIGGLQPETGYSLSILTI